MDRPTRINQSIGEEIGATAAQVAAAVRLLDDGATVPFIARYRKEATGGLDDTQLRSLADRLTYLRELDARRDAILKSIREQDKLTADLAKAIDAATTKSELEDIYLPFKPKRRTKAMIAREKGLEPLRDAIMANRDKDPQVLARPFVAGEVSDTKEALEGARDILTEELAETADLLGDLRSYLKKEAIVTAKVVKGKEEAGAKFSDYFDRTEPWASMPSHRALALMRAVGEGVVRFDIGPDPETGKPRCENMVAARLHPTGNGPGDRWLRDVAAHAWKTRLSTAMTTDLLADLRARAHEEAIAVFARNLKDLLLAAPAGARPTLGLDPGIRTGVKAAVIDATGKVLDTATLYPFQPKNDLRGAQAKILELVKRHGIELIAIGNGTASRETGRMVEETLKTLPKGAPRPTQVTVSEAGASVYSASELAATEFPDLDVSLRGAVSIARRLQDPLSELVKIEPKAIGVGQYQHDVDQRRLAKALEAVVEDAVNAVGVDLNTASAALLSHVAGLTPTLAANIVAHRDENGPFRARKDLLKVKGLGPKAFEQCAGFLRIRDGKEPLDASSVHPEAYGLARQIVIACGRDLRAIQSNPDSLRRVKPETFVTDQFGLPTVRDILRELEKPGRDPRPSFKTATFAEGVDDIADLREGMRLEGTVTNVAAFGAFVDIGVHQDGLVHVSQLADRFVKDQDSRDEVDLCAAICDWTAEAGPEVLADEERSLHDGRKGIITKSPIGVIYGIQPWNFPAYQAVRYAIANLMAGNGVLLKHAEICTGSGLMLRDIFEDAGLPKNLFTVMLIDHDQSDKLIAHKLVRGVTMTGSAKSGSIVAAKAGEHLKKTVMELGSNDAYLVLEDADVDLAVKTCVTGRIYNNGQTCVNAKRFIVSDKVYDAFIDGYVKAMGDVTLGDPKEDGTKLGPMARKDLRETLHDQVEESVAKGAKIAVGGQIPDGEGYYYPATVLTDVKPGQPAYDDELFGPVASVIRAKDDEDAMSIANDSRFGLGGGIFSRDEARALKLAKEHFDTGMVFINNFNLATPEMPFGGVKDSGYGREHGGFGMTEFVNAKAITLPG